jgi:DinB superfamily
MPEHWNKDIDKVTEKFVGSFGSLTETQLNYKPDPNVWSIAQNIDHLILLNSSYFQNFDEIKKGKHKLPATDDLEQIAENTLQNLRPYANGTRTKRANTWDKWQPSKTKFDHKILKDFTDHQSEFKKHINEFQGFNLHQTFIKYPGEANLIFRLDECIDFLIEHENRHWIQANDVIHVYTRSNQ